MKPRDMRIVIPEGFEVERIDTQDGAVVVTLKKKERQLPKSWEEFCEMNPNYVGEFFIGTNSSIIESGLQVKDRNPEKDRNILPDRTTAEAVLALCQLIQLRNCYNGDWVPDWTDEERKYTIDFYEDEIWSGEVGNTPSILLFKTKELRDEFLRNFRPIIEKLKPLYGIRKGEQQ